jgi:hypothetical protein
LRVLRRKKKRRSNRQPRAAARGRPPPWCPAATAGGEGKEHAPAPGARPHTAQQSKTNRPTTERSDLRGGWGHVAPTLPASPRPRRVRHERAPPVPLHAQGLRPRSASTDAHLARPIARAGGQTTVAVLLVRAAHPVLAGGGSPDGGQRASGQNHASHQDHLPLLQRSTQPERSGGPGLDTGALRQYSASLARREPGKQRDRSRPSSPALYGRETPRLGGRPGRLGKAATDSGTVAQPSVPTGA